MKTFRNVLVAMVLVLLVSNCKNQSEPEVKTVSTEVTEEKTTLDPNATYAKAEFTIEGMTCAVGCAKTIESKLAKMEGVKTAAVDFDRKLAMVEYDEARVNHNSLEETVTKAGSAYKVAEIKTVEDFSAKKACDPDCDKACCSGKEKAEAEKTACAEDCKKACCASKA
ncbi:MAG: heavy-metal-associated domain-containing protein [Flavobacteriaceae bacterium]|nr:cation transporter [Bacteroidia bacterium]NNK88658.1 heavy-metal-associated domain-containing protein [Flavobacteriaceae bacterium]